jgi:AraC-like DNA-binding protein/beta-xylosidase
MELLRCLLDGFGGATPPVPTRADRFCDFVASHYDEPLTLAQAASFFSVTPEHFSKAFKREVGVTFHAYLSDVRLDAATERLCESDDTVARVALEAGFPNVGALNQAFRARYGTTPMRYRRERSREVGPGVVEPPGGTVRPGLEAREVTARREDAITIDAARGCGPLHAPWRSVIGLGTIDALFHARMREQALWLKRHLTFERWSIGCDFMRHADARGRYDLFDALGFLVDHDFVPHVLVERTPGTDVDAYLAAFSSVLQHCANSFSVDTIRRWRFEVRLGEDGARPPFADHFRLLAGIGEALERYGFEEGPLGPGILCDRRCDNLRAYLAEARLAGVAPSGITISCRPMAPAEVDGRPCLVRTADRHYLRSQVLMAREALAEAGLDPDQLSVSSWRDSLEDSNVVNDSCYEGASIVRTVLSSLDVVSSLCYSDALDLSGQVGTTARFLSGRPGILSRDGIPKPSFFALDFLSHIGEHLVFANERCLASGNRMGNYQIVCHNCEQLNAAYLATPEDRLEWGQLPGYFDDPGERTVSMRMVNMRPGTYLIKERLVNADGGSVGDEAMRMRVWCMDEPGRSEIEHLKAAATPQMLLERALVGTDGVLEIRTRMQSNEIAYFHVIYLY